MTLGLRTRILLPLTFAVSVLVAVLHAQTPLNVLNPASDLSGKTLVTAEGNRTITGTFTYAVPVLFAAGSTATPGVVGSADTTTGWVLSVGSISGSLSGTNRFLLDGTGLTIYGNSLVDNTGFVQTGALGTGVASATTFLRGDRTWQSVTQTVDTSTVCGRLTLTTNVPVTTSDVTAATTLYYTPISGCNQMTVWSGTANITDTLTQTSVAVPSTTSTMYDVFAYNNAGAINIETLAWTNDTTRATAITLQNGFLAKSGDATRRYVGSIRTTTVSGQTEDSATKRYVWNYYNRVRRPLFVTDATDTWAYTTTTWRQANNSTANQVDVIVGMSESPLTLTAAAEAVNSAGDAVVWTSVGEDSTSTPHAKCIGKAFHIGAAATTIGNGYAMLTLVPAVGRHFYAWLEKGNGANTTTWHGDNANATDFTTGLSGWFEG